MINIIFTGPPDSVKILSVFSGMKYVGERTNMSSPVDVYLVFSLQHLMGSKSREHLHLKI